MYVKFACIVSDCVSLWRKPAVFAGADLEVFPKHELLGWYSTGTAIDPNDIELHKSVRPMPARLPCPPSMA